MHNIMIINHGSTTYSTCCCPSPCSFLRIFSLCILPFGIFPFRTFASWFWLFWEESSAFLCPRRGFAFGAPSILESGFEVSCCFPAATKQTPATATAATEETSATAKWSAEASESAYEFNLLVLCLVAFDYVIHRHWLKRLFMENGFIKVVLLLECQLGIRKITVFGVDLLIHL